MTTAASPAGRPRKLRGALFTAFMFVLAIVMGLVCSPFLLGPRDRVRGIVRLWVRVVLGALRLLCGVRVEVRGREHAPRGAALIPAKHQGMLDTIAPFLFLDDPCIVLKQELMRIPIYGWYAAKLEMIPVNREAGAKALRDLVHQAQAKLAEGRQIIIYPEGTRTAPGAPPDYKPGIAGLYRDLNTPCTPMATNSGLFWPAHGLAKSPGTAVFEFLPPIPPGLKRGTFMQELQARIETASTVLLA
jgi:1-acyl-sn-glycerol-3-phosphate acyltransferase